LLFELIAVERRPALPISRKHSLRLRLASLALGRLFGVHTLRHIRGHMLSTIGDIMITVIFVEFAVFSGRIESKIASLTIV
jgi:hypothetical protein